MPGPPVCLLLFPLATAVKLSKFDTHDVQSEYYWPSGRGPFLPYSFLWAGSGSSSGATQAQSPFNLKESLNWTWHSPTSRYSNVPVGANIDEQKNIYLTSLDGIRKFSPDGQLFWQYTERARFPNEEFPGNPSLYKGALYTSTTKGRIIAIDMATGEKIWMTQVSGGMDVNNAWVSAGEDTVIAGTDHNMQDRWGRVDKLKDANHWVTGFNATDGRLLWRYRPEAPVWNFHAAFAGDGTFIFQDYEGRAYRCRVSSGTEVWKKGGAVGSWTDGSAILGPNRVVYTVQNSGHDPEDARESTSFSEPGQVVARSLDDGELLWTAEVPHPPNNVPAIGRLYGHKGLSLVQPIGDPVQGAFDAEGIHSVYAFDAETGKVQWKFEGPTRADIITPGDLNLVADVDRLVHGVKPVILPNPWSAPSIDGSGTVFVGSAYGPLYALRDSNGDGVVEGDAEVSTFDTGSTFSGSMSPAIAPGMLVIGSSDQLYVFKQTRHPMTPKIVKGGPIASL